MTTADHYDITDVHALYLGGMRLEWRNGNIDVYPRGETVPAVRIQAADLADVLAWLESLR